ncbi:hypothetical protein BJX70DRAFT_392635 [Aspergillus crustosus]
MKLYIWIFFFVSLVMSQAFFAGPNAAVTSNTGKTGDPHHLTKRARLGQKCDNQNDCGKGLFCFYRFCIAESEDLFKHLCRTNSDCSFADNTCKNGLCYAPKIDHNVNVEAPATNNMDCDSNCPDGYCTNGICTGGPVVRMRFGRRSPQLICHNDRECDGGSCYKTICVADPPKLSLESRSPQLICHNDQECGGGYCYHGICVADPPKLEARSPQLVCHNDRECDGGYCYHGICIADPPKLETPEE